MSIWSTKLAITPLVYANSSGVQHDDPELAGSYLELADAIGWHGHQVLRVNLAGYRAISADGEEAMLTRPQVEELVTFLNRWLAGSTSSATAGVDANGGAVCTGGTSTGGR